MIDLNEVDESYFDSLFAESKSLVSEDLGYYRIEVEAGDIVNLITRLREAEKDAARYRWLRDVGRHECDVDDFFDGSSDSVDGKIDQAMKEKGDE